jgi:hypothetical protein
LHPRAAMMLKTVVWGQLSLLFEKARRRRCFRYSRVLGGDRTKKVSGALFSKVKMPSLLALHVGERAIGGLFVSLPIQRHSDGEAAWRIFSNDLDTAYRFASRPLTDGFQALFSECRIAHTNSPWIRHTNT